MTYRSENENLKSHVRTLRAVAVAQLILIVGLWHGWEGAKRAIRVHLPPDLRSGAVVKADDPHPENVYAFAKTIFQSLNYWPEDGQVEYGKNIFQLTNYFTPRYLEELAGDLEQRGKRGELSTRARSIQEIPGHGYEEKRVRILGNGAWVVRLDMRVHEYVRGVAVKTVSVVYPLRVVRMETDPSQNPWGLAIDGFDGDGPERYRESAPPHVSPASSGRKP